MTDPTLLELADTYARNYFMGRSDDSRKRLQAAIMTAETKAHNDVLEENAACLAIAESHANPLNIAAAIRARGSS